MSLLRNLYELVRDRLDPDRVVCRFPRLTDDEEADQ